MPAVTPVFDFGDAEMKPDFTVTLANEAPAVKPIVVCQIMKMPLRESLTSLKL